MNRQVYILHISFLWSVFLLVPVVVWGQSDVTTWKNTSIGGGISATSNYYKAFGGESRRDPYFWMLQANMSLTVGPLSLPFSASISTQDKQFSYPKPFNHYGLSPSYESVTAHLGYRSLMFSEFTLSGQEFLGAGVEYVPENIPWRVRGVYGRFQKAGTSRSITGIPQYERWGYGTKISYEKQSMAYDLIFFKAKDEVATLDDSTAAAHDVSPAENLVLGVVVSQDLLKRINLHFEYAFSAYTDDIRQPEMVINAYSYVNNFGSLFTPRASSRSASAFNGGIDFKADRYTWGISYRRVAPDYATLGAPYLTNDFEDITGNLSFMVAQGKASFGLSAGTQRNNLEGVRANDMHRFVGSANVNYTASERLTLNASFSNFNSSTEMQMMVQSSDGIEADTVIFRQVNTNATLGSNYLLSKDGSQSIAVNASFQKASDNQGSDTRFFNLNIAYQRSFAPSGWRMSGGLNANNTSMVGAENQSLGPSLTVSRSFLSNKVSSTLNTTAQYTYNAQVLNSKTWLLKWNGSWRFGKKQLMNLSASYTNRQTYVETVQEVAEFRATLGYNHRF